jgi:effector-binding domain-containing protein
MIQQSWQALVAHLEELGEQTVGPCRELYLEAPLDEPDAWVTELQQPVV